MNLLPKEEKQFLINGFRYRFFIVINILISISFLIGLVLLLPSYFLTREHFNLITSVNPLYKEEEKREISDLLNSPQNIDSRINFFRTNFDNIGVVNFISSIISQKPKNLVVTSMRITRSGAVLTEDKNKITVVVSGLAQNRESLVNFGDSLKKSEVFSSVDIPVFSLTKEKNVPFNITVSISNKK